VQLDIKILPLVPYYLLPWLWQKQTRLFSRIRWWFSGAGYGSNSLISITLADHVSSIVNYCLGIVRFEVLMKKSLLEKNDGANLVKWVVICFRVVKKTRGGLWLQQVVLPLLQEGEGASQEPGS